MDYSATITTRNVMALWGDGGRYEGCDNDSKNVPRHSRSRMRVVVVRLRRVKREPERNASS